MVINTSANAPLWFDRELLMFEVSDIQIWTLWNTKLHLGFKSVLDSFVRNQIHDTETCLSMLAAVFSPARRFYKYCCGPLPLVQECSSTIFLQLPRTTVELNTDQIK